jgi:hypothetical protein
MPANSDEALVVKKNNENIIGIGNFHKSLPHNQFGEVVPSAYRKFALTASTVTGNFEDVDRGQHSDPTFPPADLLVSPLAGKAKEFLGPDPLDLEMLPAPGVQSVSTAAEMTELYWMALLRDLSFDQWTTSADVGTAIKQLNTAYGKALKDDHSSGSIRLGLDLPKREDGFLDIGTNTVFRSGLPNEQYGPLVSQFFLHDVTYGTQIILQKQYPYKSKKDFLIKWEDWLNAQNSGLDTKQDGYPMANNPQRPGGDFFEGAGFGKTAELRRIRNMRDLARFVHKDALHQAYFNAALLLLSWGAPVDPGNPYRRYLNRQRGFATLGGPHLLSLVSEVASRALKVVWRQKWAVNRRLRPEAYGGLVQMQIKQGRPYGLPLTDVITQDLLDRISNHNQAQGVAGGSFLLPLAFSSGSPIHPAYGAGHASVAGACVTILKAWFDEDQKLSTILSNSKPTSPLDNGPVQIVQPDGGGDVLKPYLGNDLDFITVGGELNKIASNVAMGRSMGGVHWRSDNTRSLRLGEQVATVILRRQSKDYAEPGLSMSYQSFDGYRVTIDSNGQVSVDGNPALESFYMQEKFAPRS